MVLFISNKFCIDKVVIKMILGVGCDLIEIPRIRKALGQKGFVNRVYAEDEIIYCLQRGKSSAESFAARFAAKEAFLKAMGTGLRDGKLIDIVTHNDELGQPYIELRGIFAEQAGARGVKNISISLSHNKGTAMAVVILEG